MELNRSNPVRQWVENAKRFYGSAGRKLALEEFSDPHGMFVRGDMYIFALDFKGVMLAHGIDRRLVGEDFTHLRDPDGKFFIKEIIESASLEPCGCVEYKWFNQVTGEWIPKITHFQVVDDLILCGAVY